MRKYGRATTLLLLFLICLPRIFSDSLFPEQEIASRFPGLTKTDLNSLAAEGEVTRYFYSGDELSFFPLIPEKIESALLSDITHIEPTVGVESLFLMEAPGLTGEGTGKPGRKQLLIIYNTLRSVSSLEGVEYYSASRQQMRTFFKEAYVVADAKSRKKLPDPIVETVPGESTLYIHQRDLTFGRNVSEAVYRYRDDVVNLSLTNLLIMRYALLPFVRERGMQSHMIIIPIKGYIAFYAYCGVETISFLGIEKTKGDSFYNRMKALFSWFRDNLPPL